MPFKGQGRRRLLGAGLGSVLGSALASLAGCAKPREKENPWKSAYQLDASRGRLSGSEKALAAAIRRGADLRIRTEFKNNEHIDTGSDNAEAIQEVAEFAGTYLIEDRWVAGIMTLRQPISLPEGFGSRPSMSFFLYNQDGRQAIARPFLDGGEVTAEPGPTEVDDHGSMPKYHQLDSWDKGTNAPSSNFIYDFDLFNYLVRDDWEEVLAHTAKGKVLSGSAEELGREVASGKEVKIAVRGLCADLAGKDEESIDHEVFVKTGSCYYYTEQNLFIAGTHPLVRVKPGAPLQVRESRVGLRMADGPHRRVCGPPAAQSLHPEVRTEPGALSDSLVCAVRGGRPSDRPRASLVPPDAPIQHWWGERGRC